MENFPQFEALRRDEEILRYQFISTELDLALTFIGISRSFPAPKARVAGQTEFDTPVKV